MGLVGQGGNRAFVGESTREELEQRLRMLAMEGGGFCQVDQPLDVQSLQGLLRTQGEVLAGARSELVLAGRQIEPGIWLGRDASVHPSADLRPPVFVGENCHIEAGVQVGPNAAVGGHCIIGKDTTLENTAILPRTCVGEDLSLKDSMVDGNRLANVGFDVAVEVGDELLLSSIDGLSLGDIIGRTLGRLGALTVLLLTWPLVVLAAFWVGLTRRGPVWQSREVVRLPAFEDEVAWDTCRLWRLGPDPILERGPEGNPPNYWRHFVFNFIPGLISVVRGDLALIGVSPRNRQEVKKLNADWQELYLKSRAGLLCEAHLWGGDWEEEEEFYAADACYAVCASLRADAKVLARYLARLFWPFAKWGTKSEIAPWADPFVPNQVSLGGLNNYKAVDRE